MLKIKNKSPETRLEALKTTGQASIMSIVLN